MHNRSAEDAALHLLPTLWFRNTWSWTAGEPKPRLVRVEASTRRSGPSIMSSGSSISTRSRGRAAVLRERDERCRGSGGTDRRPASPRMASATTSCMARTPSTRTAKEPRWRRMSGSRYRRRAGRDSGAAHPARARRSSPRRSPAPTS